jgi:hypothetical protein
MRGRFRRSFCIEVGRRQGEPKPRAKEAKKSEGCIRALTLGNVYLHYALDRWFERRVKPRLRGQTTLFRYADDFVIGFEYKDDAKRVMDALGERLGHFGLTLHPDKTRLLPFRRPPKRQEDGKGRATFDFLGFTFYWARTRKGRWAMTCKTRSASLRRFIGSVCDWCRRYRHLPVAAQHKALKRRIQGHFNYFGISGNFVSLLLVFEQVRRAWYKWLCRRSQRKRLTWERFADLLRDFPLPKPRIVVRIWSS